MSTFAEPRQPVTFVPMSDAVLPAVDMSIPPWPGTPRTSGGVTMHVRVTPGQQGSPTAVYVHGLGGSATNWTDLADQLSGSVNGLAVDLPGFGRSEPPRDFDYSIPGQAETVARFIRGLDVGPVELLGNSMGGAIAMHVAADHPDIVRTLTLVSPAVPDLRPFTSRISDPRLIIAYAPLIGASVRRRIAADPQGVGLFRSWLRPRAKSFWTLAPRIAAPTLVVWGAADKLVTVRKAPRTARLIPRARLLVLPRTGHVAQMERPGTVARAVLGMWEQVAAGKW